MAGHSSVSQSAPAHTHIPITTLWNSEWVTKRHGEGERDGRRESKSVRKNISSYRLFYFSKCAATAYCTLDSNGGIHYPSWERACVCLHTSMHDQKSPEPQRLPLIVYMCGCSLAQRGDETRYKLSPGPARCRLAQLSAGPGPTEWYGASCQTGSL